MWESYGRALQLPITEITVAYRGVEDSALSDASTALAASNKFNPFQTFQMFQNNLLNSNTTIAEKHTYIERFKNSELNNKEKIQWLQSVALNDEVPDAMQIRLSIDDALAYLQANRRFVQEPVQVSAVEAAFMCTKLQESQKKLNELQEQMNSVCKPPSTK